MALLSAHRCITLSERRCVTCRGSQGLPGALQRKAPCQFGWDWGPQLPPIGFGKTSAWKALMMPVSRTFTCANSTLRSGPTGSGSYHPSLASGEYDIVMQVISPQANWKLRSMDEPSALKFYHRSSTALMTQWLWGHPLYQVQSA